MTDLGPSFFVTALACQILSQKSILTAAPRAPAGPGPCLALVRARSSGFGGRAQPAAHRIMSHGHWNHFGRHPSRQPARIQHRIHASVG